MLDDHLLIAENVSKSYGDFVAMRNLDFKLYDGELVSVVGPNGAGKTTLVNVLTGLHAPTEGRVRFNGVDISGLSPVELSTRGLVRAFQLVSVFPDLTVRDTLTGSCSTPPAHWRVRGRARGSLT